MDYLNTGGLGVSLPPYLLIWEPMEPDQLPLQVALLTMELAAIRGRLALLELATGAIPPADLTATMTAVPSA